MNMKKDIFENKACPFTIPEGYFDAFQKRIMSRIQAEENRTEFQRRTVRMYPYRKLMAAAACILFIFTSATLYVMHTNRQSVAVEMTMAFDEEFYRWFYASDRVTQMAESLDIPLPENFMTHDSGFSEEDEAIIAFLERDNIHVAAILYSIDDETFSFH